jgi:hypothetical protein
MSDLPRKPVADDVDDEVKASGNGEVTARPDADVSPAMEEAPPVPESAGDTAPSPNGGPAMTEAPPPGDTPEPSRYPVDLRAQEAREGEKGPHVLDRHSGLTDEELRDRFRSGDVKNKASTFTDDQTAQQAVQGAVDKNADKIQDWLGRPEEGELRTEPVTYPEPVGRVLSKDDYLHNREPTPANTVTLVLRRDEGQPGFVVHTAMLRNRTEARTR